MLVLFQLLSHGAAWGEGHTEVAIQHLGILPVQATAAAASTAAASGAAAVPTASVGSPVEASGMDVSSGGPGAEEADADGKSAAALKTTPQQSGASATLASARKPSLDSMLLASSSGDGAASAAAAGISTEKVPKAVVSDHEDDDDLDADAIKAQDEAAEAAIKVRTFSVLRCPLMKAQP